MNHVHLFVGSRYSPYSIREAQGACESRSGEGAGGCFVEARRFSYRGFLGGPTVEDTLAEQTRPYGSGEGGGGPRQKRYRQSRRSCTAAAPSRI